MMCLSNVQYVSKCVTSTTMGTPMSALHADSGLSLLLPSTLIIPAGCPSAAISASSSVQLSEKKFSCFARLVRGFTISNADNNSAPLPQFQQN